MYVELAIVKRIQEDTGGYRINPEA